MSSFEMICWNFSSLISTTFDNLIMGVVLSFSNSWVGMVLSIFQYFLPVLSLETTKAYFLLNPICLSSWMTEEPPRIHEILHPLGFRMTVVYICLWTFCPENSNIRQIIMPKWRMPLHPLFPHSKNCRETAWVTSLRILPTYLCIIPILHCSNGSETYSKRHNHPATWIMYSRFRQF